MVEKKRKKRGRKAINIDHNEVFALAKTGMGVMDICRNLNGGQGVSWDVFDKHRKKKKEISDALERGQSASVRFVSSKLMESIEEGSFQSIQFFLRNRRPHEWNKDQKVSVEHTVDLKNVIDNARERLGNDQNIIEGKIKAETLDIKDINQNNSKSNKGSDRQPEEDKDNK
jgi:hypothetical protein